MTPRQDMPLDDGKTKIDQLRTALAINRGMEFIENLPKEVGATVEHDEGQRLDYLVKLYTRIHEEIFRNWKQEGITQRPGQISSEGIITLREALLDTLCYPNGERGHKKGHHREPLFDSNGFVISHTQDELAGMLGDFYGKMQKAKPFKYGNELTLNLFLSALGKLPAYEEVFKSGIDFRRIDNKDFAVLHSGGATDEMRADVFKHVIDSNRGTQLSNKKDGHKTWEKHVDYVHGVRFLDQKATNGTECYVTVNGGLVPKSDIKEQLEALVVSNTPLADYPPIRPDQIKEYLPGTEPLREKKDIDGIPVINGAAPLLCLDFNILTGLSTRGHEELEHLITRVTGEKDPVVFDLANNDGLYRKLLAEAGNDERMHRMIEIAHDRLSTVTPRMNALEDEIFEGKTRSEKPVFVESFGGAGSGKTSVVENVMRAKCGGDNFVVASLDSFRSKSDLYKVVVAAGHHSDDYRVVEPFANQLRTWVANRAKAERKNVLYDGTGITFETRYSRLAQEFKDKGYRTEVVGVDVPLSVAAERVIERFEGEKDPAKRRALPWIVTIGKHVRSPRSFMQAVDSTSVDKVSLFSNEKGPNEHYLIAETFPRQEQPRDQGTTLPDFLRTRILSHADSMLRSIAGDQGAEKLMASIENFKKGNVFNLSTTLKNGAARDLAIYDVARFNEFLDKSLVNPYASGQSGWGVLPKSATFLTRQTRQQAEKQRG